MNSQFFLLLIKLRPGVQVLRAALENIRITSSWAATNKGWHAWVSVKIEMRIYSDLSIWYIVVFCTYPPTLKWNFENQNQCRKRRESKSLIAFNQIWREGLIACKMVQEAGSRKQERLSSCGDELNKGLGTLGDWYNCPPDPRHFLFYGLPLSFLYNYI